ncbi:MAG: diadenylate cyclase CdaA [Dehalococcoidia bacterium]
MPDFEHFREVVGQFRPASAIDVLIIAVLLFSTLRLLSGTRAMTQVRGALVLVLVAVILGRAFDLTVMNWLVSRSLPALLIGAAIIFQPELRSALDRLGRTGIRGAFSHAQWDEVIDAIALATSRMSLERHGGLVVIERSTGLQDVIETGVAVDARVSPELLAGIFYPNSPLHDMAVVLRGERVVAAGCVLPLANDLPFADRQLGTRHRAAIGITEHTDACSVVVSEETGAISLAVGGRLVHVPDERRLRAMLEMLLGPIAARPVAPIGGGRAPV